MENKLKVLAALDAASMLFPSVEESGRNNHQNYRYAKLKDIYHAVRKPMQQFKLRILHDRAYRHDIFVLVTRIVHLPSGEFLEDVIEIIPERPGAQGHAAGVTYLKKVALKNLLAIDAGEDDDDGEANTIYAESISSIGAMVSEHSTREALWDAIKKKYKIRGLKDIHPNDIESIKQFIADYRNT